MSKLPTQWQYNDDSLQSYKQYIEAKVSALFELKNKNENSFFSMIELRYSPFSSNHGPRGYIHAKPKFSLCIALTPKFIEEVLDGSDIGDWIDENIGNKIPYYLIFESIPQSKSETTEDEQENISISIATDLIESKDIYPFFKLLRTLDPESFADEIVSELMDILNFRTVTKNEVALLETYQTLMKKLKTLDSDVDPSSLMEKIIQTADHIQELQFTSKIFYELSKDLVNIGLIEPAKDLLEQTIFKSEDDIYHANAHELMYHASRGGTKDVKRKQLKEAIPHLLNSFDGHRKHDRIKFNMFVRDLATLSGDSEMFDGLIETQSKALEVQTFMEILFIFSEKLYAFNKGGQECESSLTKIVTEETSSSLLLLMNTVDAGSLKPK